MAIDLSTIKAELLDVGDDVLLARVTLPNGELLEARGWVSATTNHYDADQYGADGHLLEGAQPRAMTPDEVGHYALGLVVEQNAQRLKQLVPEDVSPPTPVAFTIPPDSDAAAALASVTLDAPAPPAAG